MDYFIPDNIRASSSAFAWGRQVHTDYNTGCHRKMLLQSRQVQGSVPKKYERLGKINEDRFAARLDAQNVVYFREVEFQVPTSVPGITVSGHIDFTIYKDGKPDFAIELKSVTGKTAIANVFKKGHWKTENLAQLVCYLSVMHLTQGQLIYTSYDDAAAVDPQQIDQRIFDVSIDDFGKIFVNSNPTQYTVYDMWAHQEGAAAVIKSGAVSERPYRATVPFIGPCHFCDFKATCDAWDQGAIESANAFVEHAKSTLKKEDIHE